MAFDAPSDPSAHTDASAPAVSSAPACGVCGHRALGRDGSHEHTPGLGDRLVCEVCGAHRVVP